MVWYRTLVGGSWSPWTSLDGAVAGSTAIAATPGTLLAFGVNSAGTLWDRRYGTSWTAWESLDGTLQSAPEAATVGTQVYVFAINAAGNTWYRVWNGSSFGGWQNLGGALATE